MKTKQVREVTRLLDSEGLVRKFKLFLQDFNLTSKRLCLLLAAQWNTSI